MSTVPSYNAAPGKSYTAAWVAADDKLTLTAKTAGAVANAPTTDITGVTVSEDRAGADEVVTPGSPTSDPADSVSVAGTNSVTVTFDRALKVDDVVTVVDSKVANAEDPGNLVAGTTITITDDGVDIELLP